MDRETDEAIKDLKERVTELSDEVFLAQDSLISVLRLLAIVNADNARLSRRVRRLEQELLPN